MPYIEDVCTLPQLFAVMQQHSAEFHTLSLLRAKMKTVEKPEGRT